METENGQIHQLHSMYIPFAAALLHGRPLQVPPASLVFIQWSPLTSLPNSNGSAPQLATAIRPNQLNVGPRDSYSKLKMVPGTSESLNI